MKRHLGHRKNGALGEKYLFHSWQS